MGFIPFVQTGSSITLPIPVADGGTGQITAVAGLNALGGASLHNDIGGTSALPTVVSTHLSAALPRNQGGTGVITTPAAPAGFAPANPVGTVSATLVMMGLGGTCTYTPASSGKILVVITGNCWTTTGATNMGVAARYGTSTAPNNGDPVTGTTIGRDQTLKAGGTAAGVGFGVTAVVSLSAGTAYWFDVALSSSNASDTATANSVTVSLVEIS